MFFSFAIRAEINYFNTTTTRAIKNEELHYEMGTYRSVI